MSWRRRSAAPPTEGAEPSWSELIGNARLLVNDEGLAELNQPFDLPDFVRRIEHSRGLTVRLIPVDLGAATKELCGTYIRTGDLVLIYYIHASTELYRLHNIVHELGHLLFGHVLLTDPLARRGHSVTAARRSIDEAQADALGAALLGDVTGSGRTWIAAAELRRTAARLKGAIF